MDVIWVDVRGYEGKYQVSSEGRVRSLDRVTVHKDGVTEKVLGKLLNINYDSHGYSIVTLYSNGQPRTFLVHRLVAQAFIPNPNNLPQVNHIDRDKTNNRVDNLEWISQRGNVVHACKLGVDYCYLIRHVNSGAVFWSAEECGRAFSVTGSTILHLARNPDSLSRKLPGQHFEIVKKLDR